ncbi:MAG: DUF6580 family putative transport protein [Phycisphaeraceae bacterium]
MWNTRTATLIGILLAAVVVRLLPHPPNFVPIGAMALFGGAMFANRRAAFLLPLAVMLVSDLLLGALVYGRSVLWGMPFVYTGFLVYVALGRLVRRRITPLRVGGAALTGSVAFFIITNFGTWLRGTLYPMTWEGLVACYTAAIPFFRHTIAADLFYSAVLFGGFALAQRYITALHETPAHQVA